MSVSRIDASEEVALIIGHTYEQEAERRMKELADNISTLNRYLVAQQKEVSATGAWTQTKKDLQMALEVSILGVWE